MPANDLPGAAKRPHTGAPLDVALVKTSSLGDVIHALPVVTDILAAYPGARVDWVVEDTFAELPALHPGVAALHRVAMRRWRNAPLSASTRAMRAPLTNQKRSAPLAAAARSSRFCTAAAAPGRNR